MKGFYKNVKGPIISEESIQKEITALTELIKKCGQEKVRLRTFLENVDSRWKSLSEKKALMDKLQKGMVDIKAMVEGLEEKASGLSRVI